MIRSKRRASFLGQRFKSRVASMKSWTRWKTGICQSESRVVEAFPVLRARSGTTKGSYESAQFSQRNTDTPARRFVTSVSTEIEQWVRPTSYFAQHSYAAGSDSCDTH